MANYGEGGKGAVGGALGGAGIGTMIAPGIGTAIGAGAGALIGGLGGLFSGDKESADEQKTRQMLMDYYNSVNGRQPYQLGATQYGQTSDVRGRQLTLADQLQALSEGKGPSLAEQQLRSATDRNVAQQASFANSGRGGPMAAARAANNSARLGAQSAQDAASARIAESMKARELLGLNLHGIRGADEEMSRFNAGQGNQMSQAQLLALINQRRNDDDTRVRLLGGLQSQNSSVYGRPGTGDQILAGGAGLFSMGMGQYGQSKANKGNA